MIKQKTPKIKREWLVRKVSQFNKLILLFGFDLLLIRFSPKRSKIEFHRDLKTKNFIDSDLLKFATARIDVVFIKQCLNHRFDILGSGLIEINKNKSESDGLKYRKSHEPTEWIIRSGKYFKLKSKLSTDYKCIDWQRDFKSGFSWRIDRSSRIQHLLSKKRKGVDIKVPWEIGRLQHLTLLACNLNTNSFDVKKLLNEIYNEIIDFAVYNPIGYGCQWSCPMDVAIRAANIVLVNQIAFKFNDIECKNESELIRNFISNLIYDHGRFIIENLEWKEGGNNNHYLANIAGLIFISCYIETEESNQWLAFAISEFVGEVESQFYKDGVNVEGSTSYHRLSTEMVLYCTLILWRCGSEIKERLKHSQLKNFTRSLKNGNRYSEATFDANLEKILSILSRAINFSKLIQKDNNEAPQIGDNDSGRFVKVSLRGYLASKHIYLKNNQQIGGSQVVNQPEYIVENDLDHSALISAQGVVFSEPTGFTEINADTLLIRAILGKNRPKLFIDEYNSRVLFNQSSLTAESLPSYDKMFKKTCRFTSRVNLIRGIKVDYFKESGYLIIKSPTLYLFIVASNLPPNGIEGHHHNDKLSYELQIAGKDIFKDPGSFTYTAYPEIRNLYRSNVAHNVIITTRGEQNRFESGINGVFSLKNQTKCDCITVSPTMIECRLKYCDVIHIRQFIIKTKAVIVNDYCNHPFKYSDLPIRYSRGYGRIV